MPYYSTETLYQELQEVKGLLRTLIMKEIGYSIEEISLNKACKLLRRGSSKVLEMVQTGELKAITYKDSYGNIRYRFRIADIRQFQENLKNDPITPETERIETVSEMAKRIFHKN